MSKPKAIAPTPVDPVALAQAQGQANIASAESQQKLNMVGTTDPYGSVSWEADPNSPGGYRQVSSFSPGQQQLYDSQLNTQIGATNIANDQLGRVSNALSQPLSTAGLPALVGSAYGSQQGYGGYPQQGSMDPSSGSPNIFGTFGAAPVQQAASAPQAPATQAAQPIPQLQTSFDPGPAPQMTYDSGGPIQRSIQNYDVQRSIGPTDFTKDREVVTDSVWNQALSRLNPQFGQQQTGLDTRLANQGIGINSAAYGNAQDTLGRTQNDARNQAAYSAVQQGALEQERLFNQSLNQGIFANNATGQQFNQGLQQGQFANSAQQQQNTQNLQANQAYNANAGQQFGQNQSLAQFGNDATLNQFNMGQSAQNQQFNQGLANAGLSNAARQQGLNEQAYIQNQPINQLSGLLSLGQVQSPTGVGYTPTQVANTDVIGAQGLATSQQQAAYQSQLQARSAALNGLFSLGSAGLTGGLSLLKKPT